MSKAKDWLRAVQHELKADQTHFGFFGPPPRDKVNRFFWRGSTNPTKVQRAAAWLMGASFIAAGFGLVSQAGDSYVTRLIGSCAVVVGAVVFRNGFRRKSAGEP